MGKLNTISVRTAKPGRRVGGNGLCLFVAPTGGRSWVLRVQVDGRRRDIGLGTADISNKQKLPSGSDNDLVPLLEQRLLTLAEASEKAAMLRKLVKAGRDAIAERDRKRIVTPSFAEAVTKAHAQFKSGWSKKEADAFLASLKEHALPALGKKEG